MTSKLGGGGGVGGGGGGFLFGGGGIPVHSSLYEMSGCGIVRSTHTEQVCFWEGKCSSCL